MSAKDPKPEIMRLEEVALMVQAGEIKLPKFQRPFVWKRQDMLKLLDSIYKGYPIGSILIWNSTQKLESERSIAGLDVNLSGHENFPTNYLLDGQQRLTTLCGSLFWHGSDPASVWNIHFDLEAEEFIYPKESDLVNLFPLNRLIDTGDFIKQCMKFEHHTSKQKYVSTAQRLLRIIKDYKIAVVKIGDMTIDEVAPIFERINSTGRKLTIVDLMMAATWKNGFDLTKEIERIRSSARRAGFNEITDQLILRSISAAAGLGINKDDIQRLRSKDSKALHQASDAAEQGLSLALSFLRDEVGIRDLSYIPYSLQLTHFAEYFRIQPKPDEQALGELRAWFWHTSATKYFGRTNSGQNTKDIALIRDFAAHRLPELFQKLPLDASTLLFDAFNLRNASSTTFALLLSYQKPESTIDGKPIDEGHLEIKSSAYYTPFSPPEIAGINISRIIHPYTQEISLNNIDAAAVNFHLLSQKSIDSKYSGDAVKFVHQRAEIIIEVLKKLSGCEVTYEMPQSFIRSNQAQLELDEDLEN
jgi:hypothetical protein